MNLDVAINVFINEKECFGADKTIKYYKDNMHYFSKFIEKIYNMKTSEIDINDIKHTIYSMYVKELRSRKKLRGKGKGKDKLSNATVKHYADPVKYFFRYLYDEEFIEQDIARKMKSVSTDKKVLIPLFKDEIEEIDDYCNMKIATGLRNYVMIHMMLDCGMRISETYDLEIDDIYFDKNFIHIRDSKYNKDRIVPLPSRLKSVLYKYIYMYRRHCDHNYVLQNRYGDKYTYEAAKNVIRRIRESTGIERLKSHLFRHTFATSYILCGGDVASLAVLLGHSDIIVTNGYLHLANTYRLMGDGNLYRVDKVYLKRLTTF